MRSVVVVFPASMCAMMPMFRTLARASAAATVRIPTSSTRLCDRGALPGRIVRPREPALPAVVRECLVGLGHLVRVLAALDRGTEAVARVQQLVLQPLDHGLLATCLGVRHQPAQPERGR